MSRLLHPSTHRTTALLCSAWRGMGVLSERSGSQLAMYSYVQLDHSIILNGEYPLFSLWVGLLLHVEIHVAGRLLLHIFNQTT